MYYFISTTAADNDPPLMVTEGEATDVQVGDVFQAPDGKVYRVVQRAIVTKRGEGDMAGRIGIAYQIACRPIEAEADKPGPKIEVVHSAITH